MQSFILRIRKPNLEVAYEYCHWPYPCLLFCFILVTYLAIYTFLFLALQFEVKTVYLVQCLRVFYGLFGAFDIEFVWMSLSQSCNLYQTWRPPLRCCTPVHFMSVWTKSKAQMAQRTTSHHFFFVCYSSFVVTCIRGIWCGPLATDNKACTMQRGAVHDWGRHGNIIYQFTASFGTFEGRNFMGIIM